MKICFPKKFQIYSKNFLKLFQKGLVYGSVPGAAQSAAPGTEPSALIPIGESDSDGIMDIARATLSTPRIVVVALRHL